MKKILNINDTTLFKNLNFYEYDQIIFSNKKSLTIINEPKLKSDHDLSIILNDYSDVKILNLYTDNFKNKNFNIKINIELNYKSNLDYHNLDISNDNNLNYKKIFELKKEWATVNYNSASLSFNNDEKNTELSFLHNDKKTYSKIQTYSVCKDKSKYKIKCISNIKAGSAGSETHQDLRIIIFDKQVIASSDPVLIINENDVIASHANAIGMLDPLQIFYLQSRGLDLNASKKLICMSYLKKVINHISVEKLKEELIEKINVIMN
ncbi:SufD family Fe-S cluster assembly protein [Spiroplasma endosymbiont of Amphibalanus improvisus]|uniref:SufD family Fe-S cluster assembly protein n=1 Tax=Spiroplasma endosymbiont of Amphibalanus improvisus TaxID=3066327 RepID=UPI00313B6FC5